MSATYRQRSVVSDDLLEADARNIWLARYPRRRLSAAGCETRMNLAGCARTQPRSGDRV